MSKAWCILCESGETQPREGMFWIHEDCFNEIHDMRRDIRKVKQMLDDRETTEEITKFLMRMDNFTKRWNGSMEIIKKFKEVS